MSKKGKTKSKMAGRIFLKKEQYTAAEVGTRIAKPFIRAGAGVGLHYLGKASFLQGKYRWTLGPIAAILGMVVEIVVDDSPTGKLLKAPGEALTDFGLKDSLASIAPGFAAKVGLSGLGQLGALNAADSGSPQSWQEVADMIQAEQAAPSAPLSGTDRGSAWVEDVTDAEDYFEQMDRALS